MLVSHFAGVQIDKWISWNGTSFTSTTTEKERGTNLNNRLVQFDENSTTYQFWQDCGKMANSEEFPEEKKKIEIYNKEKK